MKTAIFVNTFVKMKNYDLQALSQYGIKLVAITSQNDFEKFQEKYAQFFEKIYCSTKPDDNNEKINYGFAQQVISKELKDNKNDFIRIICQSEDNLLLAAKLRDEFHIPGMTYENTLRFRDKIVMKNILKKANIRVPKYQSFTADSHNNIDEKFGALATEFGLPFVLKPTTLLGGLGVFIINTSKDFYEAMNMTSENIEYEIEEYISGTLFHCDTIRQKNKTVFATCCKYANPNFDFQLGKPVISILLKHDDSLAKNIFKFNEDVLDALELDTGISHHELFVTEAGEMIFLEIGARSPGAIITPMYRKAYNIGFEDIGFKMEMQIPFDLSPTFDCYFLSGILPIVPGIVDTLIEPTIQSAYNIKFLKKPGDKLSDCKSLRDICATIEAWNTDYNILAGDLDFLRNFQCVAVK